MDQVSDDSVKTALEERFSEETVVFISAQEKD